MKTTDLQALGLTEMNETEMMSVDGGILGVDDAIFWGIVGCVGLAIITYDAYKRGYVK